MALSMVARSVALLMVCSIAVRAQSGAADRFAPLVEVSDSVAKCRIVPAAVLQPGERGYSLHFGGPDSMQRVITAIWDSTGALRRYSDGRGDLRGPPLPAVQRGARTSIVIDFVKSMALLTNDSAGRSRGSSMTTPTDALDSKHLGPPRAMLVKLHEQCGAPAAP